ncbi:translation elongation factor Ts [Patescibacteria group bacterium]|nr:translation elongation factor Ts [Patescibacteria group bacterium]
METLKKLREQTGAGIVDCQKALKEAEGDLNKAVEILRKKGISKASKRMDKEATEGIIKAGISEDKKTAYILELNSETDFVARNEQFQEFANKLLKVAQEKNVDTKEELLALDFEETNVSDAIDALSGVIGEKIVLGKYNKLSGETVSAYIHMGGKIGIILSLDKEGMESIASDIAMHIAALNPKYIKPEDVPEEEVNKEKEIYKEQLLKEGKPENIIDKILEGKINKYYSEVCLVKQDFIKDEDNKVEDVLGEAQIVNFIRYSLS